MERQESLTILLSTVLAVEGWLFTNLLDQINSSPILEYRIHEIRESSNDKKIVVQLHNLNHSIAFKDVEVALISPSGSKIKRAFTSPVEPASDGEDEMLITENSVSFSIDSMMPKSIVRTTIEFTGNRPYLRISSQSQSILFTKPSIETYISKNQSLLLIILMPITVFFGYLVFLLMERRNAKPNLKKSKTTKV